MNSRQERVPVVLPNGARMHVEAVMLGGEEDVAFKALSLEQVVQTIEGLAEALNGAITKVKPKKASVEFGLEVGVESGKLTTLLVKGEGRANLKIALEWEG